MNLKLIFILLLSSYSFLLFSQTKINSKDSISNSSKKQKVLFLGMDLVSPTVSLFSDKKAFEAFAEFKLNKKWNAVAEIGYESNIYNENDWKVDAKGMFFRVGANYRLSKDLHHADEGFYIGGRLAYSSFTQEIQQYPKYQFSSDNTEYNLIATSSLPSETVSDVWMEMLAGAKAQLLHSHFYADIMLRPKFILFEKGQNGADNLVIPGYGKDKGNMNIAIFWGLSYKFGF